MAKTKKEMRKMMGNYADTILRYKKRNKAQEEQLKGWQEVNKVNQALVAAILMLYGADGKEKAVEVKRTTITHMLQGYDVIAYPTEDGDGTKLWLQKKEEADHE